MKCEYCDNLVPNGVTRCPSCGAAVHPQMTNETRQIVESMPQSAENMRGQTLPAYQQSRLGYILLGLFFGELGLHNFYAGYVGRGVAQLLITVLSFGFLFWVSWIWAFIEIIVVSRNAKGVGFK